MMVSWAGELAAVVASAAESQVARPPTTVGVVEESQAARLPNELETVEPCSTVDAEAWGALAVTSMVLRDLLMRFSCAFQAVWLKCTSCVWRLA